MKFISFGESLNLFFIKLSTSFSNKTQINQGHSNFVPSPGPSSNLPNEEACSATHISEKPFFPTKMLLYILVDIEKLPQHLKLVGNIARLFESGILVTYFSSQKEGLEDFEAIQQEIKSLSNHSKVKFSFTI